MDMTPNLPKLHGETLWLEDIVAFEPTTAPNGVKVLLFTTAAGRRYAIPLAGEVLHAVRKAVSPITVVGPDQIPPNNGHRA